jgi:putative phage-type endonuclease
MADAMDFGKKGIEGASRRKLKIELVAERMTDTLVSRYVTDAMAWGLEQEPAARARYEEVTGNIVVLCGFALHGEIPYFGASPDGLVGDDGLIEIKCPSTATYMEWIIGGGIPEQHKPQMAAQLAVTGRKWVDFVAFDPRVKVESHQIFIRRYEPPEEEIAGVEEAAKQFLAEVDSMFDRVTTDYGGVA